MGTGEALMYPASNTSPNLSPIELTWEYQTITQGENWNVTAFWGFEDMIMMGFGGYIDIPAEALQLVTVSEPGEGGDPATRSMTGNALFIDLAPYFANYTHVMMPNFTVRIPEGMVVNANGDVNAARVFTFNMYDLWEGAQPVISETSDPGFFNISYQGASTLQVVGAGTNDPFLLVNGERVDLRESSDPYNTGILPGEYATTYNEETGISSLTVNVNNLGLTAGAEYDLIIPEGLILITDYSYGHYLNNEAYLTLKYNATSGIENINTSSSGMIHVYNLHGVKVLETKDPSAISGLREGIYVINGKKVSIRK